MTSEQGWSAWLIERHRRGAGTSYASFGEFGAEWVEDPLKACQFVRREDAEQLAYGEDCDAIYEHLFGEAATDRVTELEAALAAVARIFRDDEVKIPGRERLSREQMLGAIYVEVSPHFPSDDDATSDKESGRP